MLQFLKLKNEKDKATLGIIICVILMIIGYLLLKFVSTLEEPPLGQTTNILIGTTFMASGFIGVLVILKYLYDLKAKQKRREIKRKKHKIVFLKKDSITKNK